MRFRYKDNGNDNSYITQCNNNIFFSLSHSYYVHPFLCLILSLSHYYDVESVIKISVFPLFQCHSSFSLQSLQRNLTRRRWLSMTTWTHSHMLDGWFCKVPNNFLSFISFLLCNVFQTFFTLAPIVYRSPFLDVGASLPPTSFLSHPYLHINTVFVRQSVTHVSWFLLNYDLL